MSGEFLSRSEAAASGFGRYFTGELCERGHASQRYTANGLCVECDKKRKAEWRTKNSRKHAERSRNWKTKNPEKKSAQNAKWYSKYRAVVLAKSAKWAAENPAKVAAKSSRRRAKKIVAATEWDRELTSLVEIEAADLCRRREAATGFSWHIDHMIPLQARKASGLHTWANLQAIPAAINQFKGRKMIFTEPGEWLQMT